MSAEETVWDKEIARKDIKVFFEAPGYFKDNKYNVRLLFGSTRGKNIIIRSNEPFSIQTNIKIDGRVGFTIKNCELWEKLNIRLTGHSFDQAKRLVITFCNQRECAFIWQVSVLLSDVNANKNANQNDCRFFELQCRTEVVLTFL